MTICGKLCWHQYVKASEQGTDLKYALQACQSFAESYVSDATAKQSVPIKDDVFEKVAAQAAAEGKSVPHMLNELLGKAMA